MAQAVPGAESRKLTSSNLAIVREALHDVRAKWEDIGIELLSKNDTDAIKKEKCNNIVDCLTEMLSVYLKRAKPEPSWRSIIAALKAKAVGESQLAEELEEKYLSHDQAVVSSPLRQQNVESAPVDHQCNSNSNNIDLRETLERQSSSLAADAEVDLFPYLDTTTLSAHERKDLIQKLSRDYKNILGKFATLQTSICESLNERNISTEKVANCALTLAMYKSDDVPQPLLPEEQDRLEEAKTIERIFILLRRHKLISYFDYEILKHIIQTYGSENDKRRLMEYVDEFQMFCRRKVVEVPPVISECTSSTRKVFKVLITADMSATLADIEAAERKIADILGLAHSVLTVHKITPGSLVLTLSIPILIADKIFPLQASQLSQLEANGFTILCDKLAVEVRDASIQKGKAIVDLLVWKKIQRKFQLPDCYALLNRTCNEGAMMVEWLIPPSTSKALLTPSVQPWSTIDFFQREHIVRVTLNDDSCVYSIQESKKLLELCERGTLKEVSSLLTRRDKGAAVNATFEDVYEGKSALMLVCERGHISLVLTVLDSGAEIDFQQKTTGQSAIFLAAKLDHLRVVRFLLAYGAHCDLTDWSGATAANVALQEGHTSLSDELHKGKPKARIRTQNLFQYVSGKMESATDFILAPGLKLVHRAAKMLVGASRSNHLGSVKYIIDNASNLDINVRESDEHAWTALMWGTNKDNLEMVELLLANNADPNIRDKVNQCSPLMLATRQGNLKMVKLLLDHGADPNAQDSTGVSSLSLAVYEHHTEIAMLLVHRGADINMVEEDGNSPLTHACVESDIELVKLFCDYNANMNHQGKRGWSPLMEAARGGFKDIVEELAKRGADLDMRTEASESAIHAATVKGHVNVVRVLANYEADLNMPNKDGLTSLMVAADKGYQGVVEVLLDGGVDVNYKHQATGWPAIFFAAKNGRVGVLKELLARGAKTELETGLKLVDVAYFFKRGAIEEEIRKKPQQVHPVPPRQHEKPLTQVPGLEAGAVGIDVTSFTKKDITIGESEEQQRTQAEESQPAEPTIHTEMGQEQSEQLDKSEVETKDVSQSKIAHVGKQESLQLDQLKDTTSTDEKLIKVTESIESTAAAESGGEVETISVPKSTDKISPDVIEEKKDEAETKGQAEKPQPQLEKEQQKTLTEIQPQRVEDTSTTTTEVVPGDSQPARSNQDIAEIAKVYELLFQAMDQRMNVQNVKKSRKGISNVAPRREDIEIRF